MSSQTDEEVNGNEIDWQSYSIGILRPTCRKALTRFLESRLDDEIEYLCEEIGLSQPEIECVKRNKAALVEVWSRRQDLEPSVFHLVRLLQESGAHELLSVLKPKIVKDVEAHRKYLVHGNNTSKKEGIGSKTADRQDSQDYITVQDVNEGGHSRYDTLLCGSDNRRNDQIYKRLKSSGVKVCDLRRDMLPGVAIYPAEASVIENRAPSLLLMLDSEMLKDQGCCFQMLVAHYIDPDARCGRWIPIKLEAEVEIPTFIKHGECLDLSSDEKLDENWEKLLSSIKGRNYEAGVDEALCALRTAKI